MKEITLRYKLRSGLGLSINEIQSGLEDLLGIMRNIRPILDTVSSKRGEIERIIKMIADNEQQVNQIIAAVSRISPAIEASVKEIEPMMQLREGETQSDVAKVVANVGWVGKNAGVLVAIGSLLAVSTVVSGVWALSQMAQRRREGATR